MASDDILSIEAAAGHIGQVALLEAILPQEEGESLHHLVKAALVPLDEIKFVDCHDELSR